LERREWRKKKSGCPPGTETPDLQGGLYSIRKTVPSGGDTRESGPAKRSTDQRIGARGLPRRP